MNEEIVTASVVLIPGADATSDELKARLKGDLSAYKVPRHLFIDAAGDLPFTDSGKIDKRSLAILIEKRVSAGT